MLRRINTRGLRYLVVGTDGLHACINTIALHGKTALQHERWRRALALGAPDAQNTLVVRNTIILLRLACGQSTPRAVVHEHELAEVLRILDA